MMYLGPPHKRPFDGPNAPIQLNYVQNNYYQQNDGYHFKPPNVHYKQLEQTGLYNVLNNQVKKNDHGFNDYNPFFKSVYKSEQNGYKYTRHGSSSNIMDQWQQRNIEKHIEQLDRDYQEQYHSVSSEKEKDGDSSIQFSQNTMQVVDDLQLEVQSQMKRKRCLSLEPETNLKMSRVRFTPSDKQTRIKIDKFDH